MKHAGRRSLQGRQKRAVSVQAGRNEQKQARIILCQSTTLRTWQKGHSLHNNLKTCRAPKAESSQQQSSSSSIHMLTRVNNHLAIGYSNGLAFGHKLPGLQHEHSSHMQHAFHTSSQEPDNPLGKSLSSSINSPLAIVCECTSPSCSALPSKCTPPAKPQV